MTDIRVYFLDKHDPIITNDSDCIYDLKSGSRTSSRLCKRSSGSIVSGAVVFIPPNVDDSYVVRDVRVVPHQMLKVIRTAYLNYESKGVKSLVDGRLDAAEAVRNLLSVRRILSEQIEKIRSDVKKRQFEGSIESIIRTITG